MNPNEMIKKIEALAAEGKKSLTIKSDGKDGHKYSAHLFVMTTNPVNGSIIILRDGQAFLEKSFSSVLPVYQSAMDNINVLVGDRRNN